MERAKINAHRTLTDLPAWEFPAWRTRSLAEVGAEEFAQAMVRAAVGDPFDTSTPQSALEDLRELQDAAGPEYMPEEWVLVEDDEGPIGVVLPQLFPDHPAAGTVFYVGVVPARRGQGWGRALHRYGLTRLAALGASEYHGSTDAENAPMRAIFATNGALEA